MDDWYANGGNDFYCSDCNRGWSVAPSKYNYPPSWKCFKCGKDGRSRQQRRRMGEKVAQALYPEEHRLNQAVKDVEPEPTVAQRAAGNHRMGHVRMHGLDITIEVARGHTRRKMGKDGKVWSKKMHAHYGYIKRTESDADGDHIDVYVGSHPQSEVVFIIDQVHPDGEFDEHKCMLGFTNAEDAKDCYLLHIPAERLGGLTPMTMPDFKHWAFNGNTRLPVKRASLIECEGDVGLEFVSTFPKLATVETLDDAVLEGDHRPLQSSDPMAIDSEVEPQITPLMPEQPPVPLPPMPPPRPKAPDEPPSPPQPMPPPGMLPPPAPAPGAPPGPPGAPPPPPGPPPGLPMPPPPPPGPPMPAGPGPTPGVPPKLAALLKRSAAGAPRAFLPEEDSPLASPSFLLPAATTAAGLAVGEPTVSGKTRSGLKGLLTGLGGVGGAALGNRISGNTAGTVAGGIGGGLLSLLLAKKLLDREEPYNVVRFRKRGA